MPSDKRPKMNRKGHHRLTQLDLPLYLGGGGRGRAGGGGGGSVVASFLVEEVVVVRDLNGGAEDGDFGIWAGKTFDDEEDWTAVGVAIGSEVGGGLSLNSTILNAALPEMWTGPWNSTP